MPSCSEIGETIWSIVFTFKTPRLVRVRSFKIGLIFRLVQLVILSYLIGYAIIYMKEYQEWDKAESSVTAKVKGIASTRERWDLPELYRRIWDTPDYVVPPQENGAFFVMTNAVITPNQTIAQCAEDPTLAPCHHHRDCQRNVVPQGGAGVMTGLCVRDRATRRNSCEITGWCPSERDEMNWTLPLLPGAANFTVYIKNSIEFVRFGAKRSNISPAAPSSYLRYCRHNDSDLDCPIFRLGYITDKAGVNFTQMASRGGVISISIEWNCNLDYDISHCKPEYKFGRLDDDASRGWNFRYAKYYRNVRGIEYRDMVKAYGILFIFTVNGKAGRFSIVRLMIAIGSGIALLGIATLACDFLLMYIVKMRQQYQERKFLELMDEDFKKITADKAPEANHHNEHYESARNSVSPKRSMSPWKEH